MSKSDGFDSRKYAERSFFKDRARRGIYSSVDVDQVNQFITSADAEAFIIASEDPSFEGHELYKKAVRNAIKDNSPPKRRKDAVGHTGSEEPISPEADPLDSLIDSEQAEVQAILVKKAMKAVIKERTDKSIIRKLYYSDRGPVTQRQVAKDLGLSPSDVCKRLSKILAALEEHLKADFGR